MIHIFCYDYLLGYEAADIPSKTLARGGAQSAGSLVPWAEVACSFVGLLMHSMRRMDDLVSIFFLDICRTTMACLVDTNSLSVPVEHCAGLEIADEPLGRWSFCFWVNG